MPQLTLNGETVRADEGELLFEVIRDRGIEVPHFCYHPELSLAGACRMCLVEIDGTVDISCTRRVEDGMDVVTDSETVAERRRGILEFMLVNHPLDCPVCDKGGECPLQDYTMGYGPAESRFHGNKRTFPKFDLGELLTQRQNRCILCYRCTRFYQEEGGREDFRVIERGNDAFVGKQPGGQLESELSGNMVDICPTGTIVTKPYLHKSRPWEQQPVQSIAGMDPLQTPITADVRGDEIMRIRPQEDPEYAKPWIDDRVRFTHEYNQHQEARVQLPVTETYFDRFDAVRERFERADADDRAAVVSPDRTLEELWLLNELFRTSHFSTFPDVGDVSVDPLRLKALMESDFICVAGTNFRHAYPMLTPFLRTAARNGARLAYLTYWGDALTIEPDVYMKERPDRLLRRLDRLSRGQGEDATDEALLGHLEEADRPALVTCEGYSAGDELTRTALRWDADWDYLRLSPGGNSKAAELIAREGGEEPLSHTRGILERAADGDLETLLVYGTDLWRDFPDRGLVERAFEAVDFLAVADYLEGRHLRVADVVLPLTTQFEEPGLMLSAEGRLRMRPRVTSSDERILEGWRMLSFWCEPDGAAAFEHEDVARRCLEALDGLPDVEPLDLRDDSAWLEFGSHRTGEEPEFPEETNEDWMVFSEPDLFGGDRRAQLGESLQGMIEAPSVECHERDAEHLGADMKTEITLRLNGHTLTRPVDITNRAPTGGLLLPWNGPGDEDLVFYRGDAPLDRVEDVVPGNGDGGDD